MAIYYQRHWKSGPVKNGTTRIYFSTPDKPTVINEILSPDQKCKYIITRLFSDVLK